MSAFLTVAIIHLLGVMSPGPDFAIVTRNALAYSRRTGLMTAAGIALGLQVHVLYSLLGIGLVISQSILLFNILKYLGAAYLIFVGWKALRAKKGTLEVDTVEKKKDISAAHAFRNGFLCNVLNPKATIFMLALFTQVIDPSTPIAIQAFYGVYMGAATFVWFSFVASVFSLSLIKRTFQGIQHWLERAMGAVLVALGIKVALATRD